MSHDQFISREVIGKRRISSLYGNNEIQKSIEDRDLEKGGEGSHGGIVTGHTASGKPIYQSGNKGMGGPKFTERDHQDAVDHHNAEMSKHYDKMTEGKKPGTNEHHNAFDEHKKNNSEHYQNYKKHEDAFNYHLKAGGRASTNRENKQ